MRRVSFMPNPNTTPTLTAGEPIRRRSPLPDPARSPIVLLLAVLVPQPWLLALNVRSYFLMAGEMDADQKWGALAIFALELALMVGTGLYAWKLWRAQKPVPWVANWAIFLPHAAYLTVVTMAICDRKLVPTSVAEWIVPTGQLLFHQWVLVMPAVFYSLLALACFPTKRGRWADMGLSVLATAGVPAAWYVGAQVLRGASLGTAVWMTLAVASTVLCLGGFLRLTTGVYAWAYGKQGVVRFLFILVIALAGPIGGLALNARIPFPTDFQSPFIYGLAALNGLLLLVPVINRPLFDRAIWLGCCAMFPFSAYFFLVYLPFLPLAIPAILFFGAGFLILVPTGLVIVHARRILEPLGLELRDGGGKCALLWAALAVGMMPGTVALNAWIDRVSLNRAIDYVFTPDYRRDLRFDGSLWATQHSLERLRDQKQATYLPFLTEYYDWAVFNGLTLSTAKMQALHQAFFGQIMNPDAPIRDEMISFSKRRSMMPTQPTRGGSFPHDVKLANLTTTTREEQGCTATRAVLTLQNNSTSQSEYVATIQVPPGVLVSGYWLKVGTELVPGQIFEKKTALWVYQMIRNVSRRDPGLLTYTSPTTLELRVFPFAGQEQRVTEIEFLTPPGLAATVKIGDEALPLTSAEAGLALASGKEQALLTIPASANLPEVTRQPYLHFLIDRSAGSDLTPARAVEAMYAAAKSFPGVAECRVTAVNYESSEVTPGLIALDKLDDLAWAPEGPWLPLRGSLLRDRALKGELLRYHDAFVAAPPGSEEMRRFPIFVVIEKPTSETGAADNELGYFASLVPDIGHFYSTREGWDLRAIAFDGRRVDNAKANAQPVRIFRAGGRLSVAPAGGETATVVFPTAVKPEEVAVFDAEKRAFEPVPGVRAVEAESRYTRGAAAWRASVGTIEDPSTALAELPSIIKSSRASGVLVPASSYIVVENSAQWQMLKLKEQQKLQNNKALDMMETPEPSAWLVGGIALGLYLAVQWVGRMRRGVVRGRRKVERGRW